MDKNQEKREPMESHLNRDPLTGESGAHPVGTGVGAAATGAVGAVVGAAGGPVGAVVGAVIGGVVGGLVGKSTAEAVNPTVEEAYWRENYRSRPYVRPEHRYEDYHPAYKTGYEGYARHADRVKTYEEIEAELQRNYETNYNGTTLPWNDAKYATRDAWDRAEQNRLLSNEDAYWRSNFSSRPYVERGLTYDAYSPAYRMGYEGYMRYHNTGRTYDEVEPELRRDYERNYGSSGLGWERAKHAARDAWHRVEQTFHRR